MQQTVRDESEAKTFLLSYITEGCNGKCFEHTHVTVASIHKADYDVTMPGLF